MDAILQHLPIGPQQSANRSYENVKQHGCRHTHHKQRPDHHSECPAGALPVALAQNHGHISAAACPEHKADGAGNHNGRPDEVERRKRGGSGKVGYKQAVHDAVDRCGQHHEYGRQR